MAKGKSTCKLLKDIRQQIADANGISYQPKECQHKGDCAGTCPACEEEIRYFERELKARKGNGFGMKVAGIAAGICATVMPMTAAAQGVKPDSTANRPVNTAKKCDVKVVDLSDGCASPVVVRGMVIGSDDKEPVIGASVVIDGTNKGVATNVDGQFALKLPPDTSLVISLIGYENQKVYVSSLLHSDNNVIVLEEDRDAMLDGIVTIATLPTCKDENKGNKDDVSGRRTDKPKSHKEKNKKKCK
ncbi:carboxypeptidase-like regulatory domain-containing protein [Prevotella melaninogenica]|uniref:Carboxypeptidase-like regulatory domain-containing protein n=1 Tax=Prevotella melaninogenica TaxID=28132 RepID=A0A7D4GRR1_9BACT|nr:carboxypeptidase-like regulatory domain-containing protein [Prevotella melaninogenica]QKH88271.1 carboxypeptidase-like regulatory domain-containing protein [Prevotella melaninogenica]